MTNSTLFSNHGHVLLFLAHNPDGRLRDVAERIGITERAVQKIVRDLQDDGLLTITKRGRRNRYRINTRKALRQPLEVNRTVGHLLKLFQDSGAPVKERENVREQPAVDAPPVPVAETKPKPETKPPQRPKPPEPGKAPSPGDGQPAKKPAKKRAKKKRARKKKKPSNDQQGSLF